MRLGSCIALEVATGVLTLSAAAWGVAFAAGAIRGDDPVGERTAVAPAPSLTAPAPAAGTLLAPPGPTLAVATAPAAAVAVDEDDLQLDPPVDAGVAPAGDDLAPITTFVDGADEALLAPLRDGKVARVKFNGGGSSLSMRLEFADGSKAAFKPDQVHRHSNPRKEIAAYRIDRLLGLGKVSPALARSFSLRELRAKIASSHREFEHRLDEEALPRGGQLRGELSWWIPELGVGRIEGKYKIDSAAGVNRWKEWLQADGEVHEAELAMVQQLSSVTVFDFLIDNLDRWSGGNANTTVDGKTLYFMDNTMAFSLDAKGHPKSHGHLKRVEKFSRDLIRRLRAMDEKALRAVLERDTGPYELLLTDQEIDALLARRAVLLAYVDDLIARHGEAKVLAFP